MKPFRFVLALTAGAALGGCGSSSAPPSLDGGSLPTVPAQGMITRGGKPITEGIITLVPVLDGGSTNQASGEIGPDGRFTLSSGGDNDGAVPGKYRVKVESTTKATSSRPRSRPAEDQVVEVKDGSELNIAIP